MAHKTTDIKVRITPTLKARFARALELTGDTQSTVIETAISNYTKEVEKMFKALDWQVIEDNGGGLHLAVFRNEECIYYASGYEVTGTLMDDIKALKAGATTEDWEQQVDDAQTAYDELTSSEYGWALVADEDGVDKGRMGEAARQAFGIKE